jgi:hypothetical protein
MSSIRWDAEIANVYDGLGPDTPFTSGSEHQVAVFEKLAG